VLLLQEALAEEQQLPLQLVQVQALLMALCMVHSDQQGPTARCLLHQLLAQCSLMAPGQMSLLLPPVQQLREHTDMMYCQAVPLLQVQAAHMGAPCFRSRPARKHCPALGWLGLMNK
jgi:hypothetical protein